MSEFLLELSLKKVLNDTYEFIYFEKYLNFSLDKIRKLFLISEPMIFIYLLMINKLQSVSSLCPNATFEGTVSLSIPFLIFYFLF